MNIFRLTTISKKNSIFQNKSQKLFLRGMTIFEEPGSQTTKINITCFFRKCGTKYSFKVFFSENPISSDLNLKDWFWGHIFPDICGSMGPTVSKNNRVHLRMGPHQPREFHENRFKIVTCIVTSHTYINI